MNKRKGPKKTGILRPWHFISILMGCSALFFHCLVDIDPQKIEFGYSRLIYPCIAKTLSIANRLAPAPRSFSELVFLAAIIVLTFMFFRGFCKTLVGKKSLSRFFSGTFLNLISMAAFGYFIFWIVWGLNFHRIPFTEHLAGSVESISAADYENMAEDLVEIANSAAFQKARKSDLKKIDKAVDKAIRDILENRTDGCGLSSFPRTKFLFSNEWMNAFSICGIFLPFFMEPHVNSDLLPWEKPCTMAHEKAHFAGYSSETDANLIAYIACLSSDSPSLRYSCSLNVLISLSRHISHDKWLDLTENRLSDKALKDMRAAIERSSRNREKYQKLFAVGAKVNDTYLKMNSQKLGVKSYRAATSYLAIWWKKGKLKKTFANKYRF